jgi:hypothetical protein
MKTRIIVCLYNSYQYFSLNFMNIFRPLYDSIESTIMHMDLIIMLAILDLIVSL